jgi:ribosomal 30S subunit maturation factor RimM
VAREKGSVLVPFDERVVVHVDQEARVITINPPAGLLD